MLNCTSNGLLLVLAPQRIGDLHELSALYSLNAIHAFCAFCGFCACYLTYCPHSVPPKHFPDILQKAQPRPTQHASLTETTISVAWSPYQRFVRLDQYVYALTVRQVKDLANLHRTWIASTQILALLQAFRTVPRSEIIMEAWADLFAKPKPEAFHGTRANHREPAKGFASLDGSIETHLCKSVRWFFWQASDKRLGRSATQHDSMIATVRYCDSVSRASSFQRAEWRCERSQRICACQRWKTK